MKKFSILPALILLAATSQLAFANSPLTGDWCQSTYDDFNIKMKISKDGHIRRALIGERHGEAIDFERGFISVGASGVKMELSNQTVSVYNVEVRKQWLSGKETLHIEYNDRLDEVFNRCKIHWLTEYKL